MTKNNAAQNPKMYEQSSEFRRDIEELYGVFFNRECISKSNRDPYELFEESKEKLVETINKFSAGASTESHNFLLLQLMVLLDRTDSGDPQGVSEAVQSMWANQERVVDQINMLSAKPDKLIPKAKSVLDKFEISGIPTPEQFQRLVGKGVDFLKRGLQPLQERGVLKQIVKIIQETVQRAREGNHLGRGTLETCQLLIRFCKNLRGSHAECTFQLKERIFADSDEIFREIKDLNERLHGVQPIVKAKRETVEIKPLGATQEPFQEPRLAGVTAFFDRKVIERAPSMQNIPTLVEEILTILEMYLARELDAITQGNLVTQLQQQARSFDIVIRVVEMSVVDVLPATVDLVNFLLELPKSKAAWDLKKIKLTITPLHPVIQKNYREFFGEAID
jgi:hypothetical protein